MKSILVLLLCAAYIALPFIISVIAMLFPLILIYGALYILGFVGKK